MRLEKRSAEYQLAVYMGAGSQYVKHRDALPDDGADPNQRRVGSTCFACSHKAIQRLFALKVELKWYKLAQNRLAWRHLIVTVHT